MMTREITLAGEAMVADARRALYWPRQRTLIVADVHFGKGDVFRRHGIAVPTGGTDGDLARLDALIAAHDPARVLVLGDLVHGPSPLDAPWVVAVREWRHRHASRAIEIVAGNHDRHFDPRQLGVALVGARLAEPPFTFVHDAASLPNTYTIGGHLHPGVILQSTARNYRLPVFWLGAAHAVLPAFGQFTGLAIVDAARGDRLIAATPGGLLDVPR